MKLLPSQSTLPHMDTASLSVVKPVAHVLVLHGAGGEQHSDGEVGEDIQAPSRWTPDMLKHTVT